MAFVEASRTRDSSLRPESLEYSVSPMPTIAHLSFRVSIGVYLVWVLSPVLQNAAGVEVFDLVGGHAGESAEDFAGVFTGSRDFSNCSLCLGEFYAQARGHDLVFASFGGDGDHHFALAHVGVSGHLGGGLDGADGNLVGNEPFSVISATVLEATQSVNSLQAL